MGSPNQGTQQTGDPTDKMELGGVTIACDDHGSLLNKVGGINKGLYFILKQEDCDLKMRM